MPRYCFSRDGDGYLLRDLLNNQRPLRIDFTSPNIRRRSAQAGKSELLLKAVGARVGLRILDCTAGLGVDAFLMAAYGCEVTLIEQSTILGLMLEQAIDRAAGDPDLNPVAMRMHLHQTDASRYLRALIAATKISGTLSETLSNTLPEALPETHEVKTSEALEDGQPRFDVIYIDPMFPSRAKSAEVKGNMQVLQKFVGKTDNVEALLKHALATNTRRVVVKRPLRGGDIAGYTPSFQQKAKSSRFDIFLQ